MSWLKKQFNKLFFAIEEDNIDGYDENEREEKTSQQPLHNEPQQPRNEQRKKFSFPIIQDDEQFAERTRKQSTETNHYVDGQLQYPKHLKQDGGVSKIYDVEVSGIRELLERRQQTGRSSRVIRSTTDTRKLTHQKREERQEEVVKPQAEQKVDPKFTNPLQNRKKFIPSTVPSPVHGYLKPNPKQQEDVVQVMEEKLIAPIDANITVTTNLAEVIAEDPQTMPLIGEEEIFENSVEQLPFVEIQKEHEISEAIIDESNEVEVTGEASLQEEPDLSNLQVEQISVSNSTIHIEQLHIVDPQSVQEIREPEIKDEVVTVGNEIEEAATPVPLQGEQVGSRLPFNVLMLKSDKQKLAAQKMSQQFYQLKPVVTERPVPVALAEQPKEQEQELVDVNLTLDRQSIESLEEAASIVTLENINCVEEPEPETLIKDQDAVEEITVRDKIAEVLNVPDELKKPTELDISEQLELEIAPQEELADEPEQLVVPVIESGKEGDTVAEQKTVPLVNELLNEPKPYNKPPLEILAPPEEMLEDTEWMDEQGYNLVEALSHFQVQAQVESAVQGPAVTQFEITVGHGTKVSKVRNLSDDIQLALAARDIRIDAPIPGKRSIGIEIPNRVSRAVRLSEVTDSDEFTKSDSPLEAALGLDLNGKPVTLDLRKMPHGLIAGATGSGKSVCINSILVSLLYKSAPHELKLMLIDPKMVELAPFNHIPHLVCPVITDVKAATESLKWAVDEMERRYQLFMHSGTRDITRYNKLCDENKMYAQKLPYLLIVIDELADLMMMSPADVELAISRLAQKARACGIHLILATQRPSVDVITGTLKSNIPTRIAFAVSSQIDSRTIIDQPGADRLLGRGDMLYLGNGMNSPQRIQGTYVTDEEIEEVVKYVRAQGEPDYIFKSEELVQKSEILDEQDELFEEVCRYVFEQGSASTSAVQRRYHIGYNRAARLIDMLESQGFISEQKGSKPRDVYITETVLEDTFS